MKSLYSLALEVQLCVVDPVYTSKTKIYKWSSLNEPKLSSGTRARLNFRLAVNNPLARGTTSLMSSTARYRLETVYARFYKYKVQSRGQFCLAHGCPEPTFKSSSFTQAWKQLAHLCQVGIVSRVSCSSQSNVLSNFLASVTFFHGIISISDFCTHLWNVKLCLENCGKVFR